MALLEDLLVTVLFGVAASFTHPGILIPTVESTGDAELKNVIKQTQRSREAREILGYSVRVWKSMTDTIRAGNDKITANKHHLLPKVWDLVILGRNLLAAKELSQNLAAEVGFEAEIRRLVSICIDKMNKALPAEDKLSHDKEVQLKAGYKKVMITALQLFNNLITCNETRKLHIWLHMFGTPASIHATSPNPAHVRPAWKVPKARKSTKPQPSPGSGVGAGLGGTVVHHSEMAVKCNTLSAGFNSKYYKPGFLTDVPRMMQPEELEPLLMILQCGIVSFAGADEAMQSVRCKLMLAQGYGRTLLREVLVFLGAWELDEGDFCYRAVEQIVEAILLNGLMPYAYECFRDAKDIITPAQSILLKLLVSVYRPPGGNPRRSHGESPQGSPKPAMQSFPTIGLSVRTESSKEESNAPVRAVAANPSTEGEDGAAGFSPVIDSGIPTFFVNAFQKQVVDPIISIIQLQGAIYAGKESKDAFELSLWDIDRIYEGLYQFMELFVLFSEDEDARKALTVCEKILVADLVRLLGALDQAIPRFIATKPTDPSPPTTAEQPLKDEEEGSEKQESKKQESKGQEPKKQGVTKHLVERPFDVDDSDEDDEDDEDDEGEDDDDDGDRELLEPEEFSWPNIKRYIVTLIGTFTWRNREIQDLVRQISGLQLILNQCKIDDDNPFIREHAILCLRALLEGNKESQAVIEELTAKEVVPSEILDKHGYEPFIDENGQVKLKRMCEGKPRE